MPLPNSPSHVSASAEPQASTAAVPAPSASPLASELMSSSPLLPHSLKSSLAQTTTVPTDTAAERAGKAQQQQQWIDLDPALLNQLSVKPTPPPPPPPSSTSSPRPLQRFDAPFALLDDDIDEVGDAETAVIDKGAKRVVGKRGRSPTESAEAVRRSTRRQQQQQQRPIQSSAVLEVPATPQSADASIPSSLPSSPVTSDSNVPTAVNSPTSANQHAAITSGRQLIDELSLIMQQTQAQGGVTAASATDGGSEAQGSKRGKQRRPKKAEVGDDEEKERKPKKAAGRTAVVKRGKPASSSYIDTTTAQDIRTFLPSPNPPAPVHSIVNHAAPPSVAEMTDAVVTAPPLTAPSSPSTAPSSPVTASRPPSSSHTLDKPYPTHILRSPHVDVAAIRKKFGLEKGHDSTSTLRGAAPVAFPSLSQHDERKDTDKQHFTITDRTSCTTRVDAAETVRMGKRKRGAAASSAAHESGVVVGDGVKCEAEPFVVEPQSLRTISITPFSPSSPPHPVSASFVPIRSDLSRHSTLTQETRAGIELDDSSSSSRQLERASTIIVHNTADDIPLARPTALHPTPASTSSQQQLPRWADESILRQASLTSTTSSTTTASAEATTRIQSTDSASSSPPPTLLPCERLPPTLPGFQCDRLTAHTGVYTIRCFAATTTGRVRTTNQDAFAVQASRVGHTAAAAPDSSVCIMGVFDGHGALGHSASQLCASSMPLHVTSLIAAEPVMEDDAKDNTLSYASPERVEHRLGCLRYAFDVGQRLLLDVARAEQEYIATFFSKQQPDLPVQATLTCQPLTTRRLRSPSPSPARRFSPPPPALPSVAEDAAHSPFPLPDVAELSIPPLVPLRRHQQPAHGDDSESEQTAEREDVDMADGALTLSADMAVANPVVERKKKKRRRRPLGKPRKRVSPTPHATPRHQNLAAEVHTPLSSDTDSDKERQHSASDDTSLSVNSLQPIQRSPVKRVPVKQPHTRQSPRPARGGYTCTPVAVDVDYGTTGLVVVIEGSDVYVANVGDSRCVLMEWRGTDSVGKNSSTVREVEEKEPPSADLLDKPRSRLRSRSPPSAINRRRSGGNGISRSFSSPSASFSSLPSASLDSSSSSPWRTLFTSNDHDPALATALGVSEFQRVLAAGGSVLQLPGQYRVYPDSLSLAEAKQRALTLNMSRALGHLMLSQHGVTHKPDCSHISLAPKHNTPQANGNDSSAENGSVSEMWMLLASDGMWDVLDADDVRQAIDRQRCDRRNSSNGGSSSRVRAGCCKGLQSNGVCLECVCCLLMESCELKYRTHGGGDNITLVLAQLTVD